jgi:aspartyl-tRNA(Asn)/glutamyl-tRNA(Gln) amidotransferase subunit C
VQTAKKAEPTIDIDNIANLARLSITAEEKKAFAEDMKSIIGFANQLSEIDTDGVDATAHVVPMYNVFREDVAKNDFDREELLAAAPTKADGYVTVPRVVES